MCVLARGLVAVDLVDSCESDTLIRYDKYQLACECTCRVLILIFVVINGVICLWINMYKCVKSAVSVWNKRSLITNMICVSCIWYSQIKTHLYSAILSIKWYIYHFMVVDKGPKIFTSIQFCFALTPTKWAKDKQKRGIKSSDINKNSTIRRMLFQIAYLNDCL